MNQHPLIRLARQRGLLSTPAAAGDAEASLRAAGLGDAEIGELKQELERAAVPPPIPGYRLIELIGLGAHSQVWRATQETVDRAVAVKIIPAQRPRDVERFLRESRAAGAIGSPYVVTCHDAGQSGAALYLVMELMTGGDAEALADAQGGRLPERRALEIIRDAARGLTALAAAGLTHRDIKPANILIADDHAKLADLGLARDAGSLVPRTAASSMVDGTPAFMSPEQVQGEQLDVRSDLFSLGATFYRLATGALPFGNGTVVETLRRIEQGALTDPHEAAGDLSDSARLMMLVAMSRTRGLRYQQPDQLGEDAESVLSGRPPAHARRLRQLAYDAGPATAAVAPSAQPGHLWQTWPAPAAAILGAFLVSLLIGRALPGPSTAEHAALVRARATGDVAAWQTYLAGYPDGQWHDEAEARLRLLGELDRLAPEEERTAQEVDRLRQEIARRTSARQRALHEVELAQIAPADQSATASSRSIPATLPTPAHAPVPATPLPLPPKPAPPPAKPAPARPPPTIAESSSALDRCLQRTVIPGGRNACGITCHPLDPAVMLAWSFQGEVWRSNDIGRSWQQIAKEGTAHYGGEGRAFWSADAKRVYLPAVDTDAFGSISEDGGRTFREIPQPWSPELHRPTRSSFGKVMTRDGRLYVGWSEVGDMYGMTLMYSDDLGASWQRKAHSATPIVSMQPIAMGMLLFNSVEHVNELRVSADYGTTWTPFGVQGHEMDSHQLLPASHVPLNEVTVIDNTPAPVIFVFTPDGTMVRSLVLDPGFAWKHFVRIRSLAIDPHNPQIWYAASWWMGLLRSLDQGRTWTGFACPVGSPEGDIHSLLFTAGPAPRLVLSAGGQALIIDDHEHGAALFPVPFTQMVERMRINDP